MVRFVLNKIKWLPLSLLLISIFCFILSKSIPYDPVDFMINLENSAAATAKTEFSDYQKMYKRLGLDKPNFYWSLSPPNTYPTNQEINTPDINFQLEQMIDKGYNLQEAKQYIRIEQNTQSLPNKTRIVFPSFKWHGLDNQYHHWISSVFKGDFGISYLDGRPVIQKIAEALKWTLMMVFIAIILSFFLGIALGVFNAISSKTYMKSFLNLSTYFIYAMPLFWLATLSLVFFTTDDYGKLTNIFPSPKVMINYNQGFVAMLREYSSMLILPIFLMTINSLSYLSRQMYNSLKNEDGKPYSMTASLKGLTRGDVVKKHQLKNALLPMITILTSAIPSGLAGSLIIETIFNIPGMGRLLYESIQLADWNIIYAIVMITSIISFLSFLLADVLYYLTKPKMKESKLA